MIEDRNGSTSATLSLITLEWRPDDKFRATAIDGNARNRTAIAVVRGSLAVYVPFIDSMCELGTEQNT